MGRLPGGLFPRSRARTSHGAHGCLPNPRTLVLSILLGCAVLLATSTLLLSRSSAPSTEFQSADISAFLIELEEQISNVGAGAAHMQLRLLRMAAGVESEFPDRASRVFSELLASIESLGHALPCGAAAAVQGPTNTTGCGDGCFFAVNLYNSINILPNMILQLLAVLGSLGGGEHAKRCFVSVYESGSTDATPLLLDVLRKLLDLLGVPNRVVTGGDVNRDHHLELLRRQQSRRWLGWGSGPHGIGGDERIRFLAKLRNAVLEPLVEPGAPGDSINSSSSSGSSSRSTGSSSSLEHLQMDRVIFINDVFFCAADVRRLLRYESSDVACGMDFVPAALWLLNQAEREQLMVAHLRGEFKMPQRLAEMLSRSFLPYRLWKKLYGKSLAIRPWSFPVFYDMWVARDISGSRIRNRMPYSLEPWTADRLAQGLPTPVYCCWNGLVNLRAEPFLRRPGKTQGSAARRSEAATAAAGFGAISDDGVSSGDSDDYAKDRREAEARAAEASTGPLPLPLRFRSHRPGECAASECSLMCDDLHAAGYHRVLLEPNVRVAYDWPMALNLYGYLDLVAPENAPGLRYRAMAAGDARQVEISWSDEWLPRVEAAARSVECCGIQPGRQTADFDAGCAPRDLSRFWWSGEPEEGVV